MLLPAERRRALYAVYAFCRFIDDIADDESAGDAASLLARWREELERVYGGAPTRAISRALADSVRALQYPAALVRGGDRRASRWTWTRKRYSTFDELRLYCYRVASAVGLICIEIFGYRNPATRLYAENLGIAFQLTNILRDVQRGRGTAAASICRWKTWRASPSGKRKCWPPAQRAFRAADGIRGRARAGSYYEQAERALPAEDRASAAGRGGDAADLRRAAAADRRFELSRAGSTAIDCQRRVSSFWSDARGPAGGCWSLAR